LLRSTPDAGLLVRVLHRVTDREEEAQPLAGVERVTVAVIRDRNARHVLHDEVRATERRVPASSTRATFGWLIRASA
jgi:hypothetical protein